MGGRKSHYEKGREDSTPERKIRGNSRGHGVHHRHQRGKDAPRKIGTGKDRTHEQQREGSLARMGDDELYDLAKTQRLALGGRSVELGSALRFGADLEGEVAHGVVVEVRKGNFLTMMSDDAQIAARATVDPSLAGVDWATRAWNWKKGELLRTIVRGTLQQFDLGLSSMVAAGDEVDVIVPPMSEDKTLYKSELHSILVRVNPRRNAFRRLHPSGRAIQTLAANVDAVLAVASAQQPDFRPGFVDRVLVCAAACGLPCGLIVNKMDLGLPERDEALLQIYAKLGVPVYRLSLADPAKPTGDVELLLAALAGKRTVLTGHSGVGKSSLLRALAPAFDPDVVRVGDVSAVTEKGRHTTTHARLFRLTLPGGASAEMVDTPGVRELTPADTDRRNLWGWFPEIAALQNQCAFSDCTHVHEDGCAVLAGVEAGTLDARRHHSYVRIFETLPN